MIEGVGILLTRMTAPPAAPAPMMEMPGPATGKPAGAELPAGAAVVPPPMPEAAGVPPYAVLRYAVLCFLCPLLLLPCPSLDCPGREGGLPAALAGAWGRWGARLCSSSLAASIACI